MAEINIGSIVAFARLDSAGLAIGIEKAQADIKEFGDKTVADMERMSAGIKKSMTGAEETVASFNKALRAEAVQTEVATKAQQAFNAELAKTRAQVERMQGASRLEQLQAKFPGVPNQMLGRQIEAESTLSGLRSRQQMAQAAGSAMLNLATGITAVAAASTILDASFEHTLVTMRNNTTMTDAEFKAFRETVISLGKESGLPFEQIAEGIRHASNEGFTMAQSAIIAKQAMMGAVATNADMAKTTNMLATVMHTFKIPLADVSKAWETLHVAAKQGNLSEEEFVARAGPALAAAAALRFRLDDVSAAYAALTRNGFTAAQANTLIRGIFAQLVHPSKQARDSIADLSRATGVDLVRDFTTAGSHVRGLSGIMEDLFTATKGDAGIIIEKLMPAMRGGFGAATLMSTGLKDLREISEQTHQAWEGKLTPTAKEYANTLQTTHQQMQILIRNIQADFLPIGAEMAKIFHDMLPVIREFIGAIKTIMDLFAKLPRPIQEATLFVGAFRAAMFFLGGIQMSRVFSFLVSGWNSVKAAASAAAIAQGGAGFGAGAKAGIGAAVTRVGPLGIGALAVGGLYEALDQTLGRAQAEGEENYRKANASSFAKYNTPAVHIAQLKAMIADYEKRAPGLADRATWGPSFKREVEDQARAYQAQKAELSTLVGAKPPTAPDLSGAGGLGDIWGGTKGAAARAEQAKKDMAAMRQTSNDMTRQMLELSGQRRAAADFASKLEYQQTVKDFPELRSKAHALLMAQLKDHAKEEMTERLRRRKEIDDAVVAQTIRDMDEQQRVMSQKAEQMRKSLDLVETESRELYQQKLQAEIDTNKDILDSISSMWTPETVMTAKAQRTVEGQEFTSAIEKQRDIGLLPPDTLENPLKRIKPGFLAQFKDMFHEAGDSAKGILVGAFEGLLLGTKNIWQKVFDEFKAMLARMVAQIAASGVINALGGLFGGGGGGGILGGILGGGGSGGGGGFLGSIFGGLFGGGGKGGGGDTSGIGGLLGGVAGILAFDDPVHDRAALRWGRDFGRLFTAGALDGHRQLRPAAAGASGHTIVNMSFPGDIHIREEADIGRVARELDRHIMLRSRVRPGS